MREFSLSALLRGASQLLDVSGVGARRGARNPDEAALRALRSAWQSNARTLRTVINEEMGRAQRDREPGDSRATGAGRDLAGS